MFTLQAYPQIKQSQNSQKIPMVTTLVG